MLSEFELIRIEGHAKNYVGSPEGKAMAKRLLELNNEIKTVLIDKENVIFRLIQIGRASCRERV